MSSAVVMERFALGSPHQAGHSQQWHPGQLPAGSPAAASWAVVPRCRIEFEKSSSGCKINCHCDDELSCATLQNLCRMLCDGLCSCSCTQNGLPCCECSFSNCHCTCEYTNDGCCISCTSGDKQCAAVLQACCECCNKCCEGGCACYVCFNGTPVCCGHSASHHQSHQGRH